uniref:Uncharacterized protein n=1 Tax=Rhizophora mucronata TaxID=61149 RepID=A0A2P2PGH0_RHIMU
MCLNIMREMDKVSHLFNNFKSGTIVICIQIAQFSYSAWLCPSICICY